jgi:very-short-patch-repair endonuclease
LVDLSSIRTADLEDELHYSLWDAIKVLGYNAYVAANRKIPRAMKRRVPWEVFGETGPRARTLTTALTENGLKYLVANSKRAAARDLAAQLDLDLVCVPTEESEVLRIVSAALGPVEFVEEHRVGNYTVAGYFPSFNVVVEADRMRDPHRDREAEFWRRVFIEDQLGCAFVVFDPKRRDFNPGDVINRILTMELPKRTEQSA